MAKVKAKSWDDLEEERKAREQEIDAQVATRSAHWDIGVKERARKYSINPDNFETEEELGAAVSKYEQDNNILNTPDESDEV